MAFAIQNNVKPDAIRAAVTSLMRVLPRESYPNGNGGYSQDAAYCINHALKAAGLPLQLKTAWRGDAYTVGGKAFVLQKGYTATTAKKIHAVLTYLTVAFAAKQWQSLPFDTTFEKV